MPQESQEYVVRQTRHWSLRRDAFATDLETYSTPDSGVKCVTAQTGYVSSALKD